MKAVEQYFEQCSKSWFSLCSKVKFAFFFNGLPYEDFAEVCSKLSKN